QVARGENFVYTATFEQIPEVKPEVYKDFKLSKTSALVEESDVDKVIEQIRDTNTSYKADDTRLAESGDQLKIDFDGYIENERFEGGKAEGHELVLGSGRFIPGFEDQLIGSKAGESVEVTLSFPEDYQAKHLAGKEALFKCIVHEVRGPVKPEINDDLAVKAGVAEGGIAKLREEITTRLNSEAENRTNAELKKQILDKLVESNTLNIPQGLVEREQEGMVEQLKQEYKRQGMDPEMLGMNPDAMGEGFADEAAKRVKVGMLLGAIAREESISASEEAVDAFLRKMSASYGDQAESMLKWMKEDPERIEGIRSTVLEAAIIDWIVNNSTVDEKTCSLEELMADKGQSSEE
ncbi:MAG: trigger factor, partial [Magnetococcales bacterium]|nr:trigger factor [Magnetococcales bacterium]